MKYPHSRNLRRLSIAAVSTLAVVGAAAAAPAAMGQGRIPGPDVAPHTVVVAGLDNPRALTSLDNGDLLISEAGHGANDPSHCSGSGDDEICIGITGKITRLHDGQETRVMVHLLSAAGPDGSFSIGADAADQSGDGPYYAIMTYAPASQVPPDLPAWQLGRVLSQDLGSSVKHTAGNVSAFERRADPDGEGFDSDPYGLLVLGDKVLVADAAGDFVAQVQNKHVSLWAAMHEYGPKVDPVPTTVVEGADGKVYVGELHSEIKHEAHVWQYDRNGKRLQGWPGFTTVTGIARAADGTLYVSELFGGPCTFDQIPNCFPGRVVKVAPNGTRTHVGVPFPAGIVEQDGHVYVNAFSVSPQTGFGGNPDWSGQVWELSFD